MEEQLLLEEEHIPFKIDQEKLHSKYIFVGDIDKHNVVWQYQANEKIHPASTTKLMSTLIVTDQISDIQAKVCVDPSIFPYLYEQNASMAGFQPYEEVTIEDLLHGVLLPSGGDATLALAKHVSGDEESFVELMNEKAHELGMNNTHFTNATGLHDDSQFTSAVDLALLLEAVGNKPQLKDIITKAKHQTKPTNIHPEGLIFNHTLYNYIESVQRDNSSDILGGKTGYTLESGQVLASIGTVNNDNYIVITAGAEGDPYIKPLHLLDHLYIYETILNNQ